MFIYGYIYIIICKITNKAYIGWAIDPYKRVKDHFRHADKNSNAHPKLYNCIRKYNIENFEWEIIDCSFSEYWIKQSEIHHIADYNSFHDGLNCTKGGDGVAKGTIPWNKGFSPSKETLKKQSLSKIGKLNGMYKKNHSNETIKEISKLAKVSRKKNIKKYRLANLGNKNPMYGTKYIDGIRCKEENGQWIQIGA